MTIFSDPQFWLLFSLLALILILYKPISKIVCSALDARTENIRKRLNEMDSMLEDANEILAKYKKKFDSVESEINEINRNTEREINSLRYKAEREINSFLNKKTSQIMDKISSEEERLLNKIRFEIVEVSTKVAENIIRNNITDSLKDEYIAKSAILLDKKIN